MKTNGKTLPAKIGPLPAVNRVSAGIFSSGWMTMIETASSAITPSFRKVDR